ncbi:uncharacterized protein L203_106051 [Cryptococcus depauperatus CBS 7841]|uniref:Glutamate--cysteine ligase n=1 Tax=Cryptococcus depauperatus CBS 7841 TaxID=1295531 RepID=A0AAJ8M428_9TREE
MGLLALGTPLSWQETKPLAEYIREHGITQFLNIWNQWKDKAGKGLLWGDEIEYMVVSFDDEHKTVKLSLRQTEILRKLESVTLDPELEKYKPSECSAIPTFHPEYGRYMLESTPGQPFSGTPYSLVSVEADMRFRREIIRSHLNDHELPITLTSWARLGVTDAPFTDPETKPDVETSSSRSQYVGQLLTNPHARFPTLTANIRQRRGSKVDIRVPLYIDEKTVIPNGFDVPPKSTINLPGPAKPLPGTPYIHMDAMAFGMGCCCLQITFQAWNVDEARGVYDALVPVAPIMLALTAASPAFRGQLADVDARWNVIAASVDDRSEEERGLKPLKENHYRIPKSRYDSVDLYIANDERNKQEYHDIDVPVNEEIKRRLMDNGIDEKLANHIGHLFIRDPLVQFSETIDQNDLESMDHFENIQSTNWQTVRFKPPPVYSKIGWRVEFRSMEVQMTDFENAAFSIFIVLLTRAIISFDLNFYMPISKVDENMQRAQQRDGARINRFFFRRNICPTGRPSSKLNTSSRSATPPMMSLSSDISQGSHNGVLSNGNGDGNISNGNGYKVHYERESSSTSSCSTPIDDEEGDDFDEMTLNEIINGNGDNFAGLLGVVNAYLNSLNVDVATKCELRRYLDLIKYRAKGDLMTPAAWIRQFIMSHPSYKQDSVVSDEINYDLVKAVDELERGIRAAPELLGKDYIGSGATGCL